MMAASLAAWRAAHGADDWRPLPPSEPREPAGGSYTVDHPGRYRLPGDVMLRRYSSAGHSGPKGGAMVTLLCGQVEIDLGGHVLGAQADIGGIVLSADSNRAAAAQFPGMESSKDNRHVTLRNGRISLGGGNLAGGGVELTDAWHGAAGRYLAKGQAVIGNLEAPNGVAYADNDYLLEDLRIQAAGLGVALEGRRSVIRRCHIDSAGNAGIFCAGPDTLIEDCDIRLRALEAGPYSFHSPLRAAIVLRDGGNAVIRNCRIRVDRGGLPADTHCILVRDGASGVTVENCTFVNVDPDDWITTMEGARVSSRGNKSERHWQAW